MKKMDLELYTNYPPSTPGTTTAMVDGEVSNNRISRFLASVTTRPKTCGAG